MAKERKSIDPWYGLPFSRRPTSVHQFGSGLLEFADQVRKRPFTKTLHARGFELTVMSREQLASVPASLASKAASLRAIAQHGQWSLDCSDIARFDRLKELSLGAYVMPTNIHALTGLGTLRRLSIEATFTEILDLGKLTHLEELSLAGSSRLAVPDGGLKSLGAVTLYGGKPDYSVLDLAPTPAYLRLQGIASTRLPSLLGRDNPIRVLKLHGIAGLRDLELLSRCRSVTHLLLERCRDLAALDGIQYCERLRELELRGCHRLANVESLPSDLELAGLFVVNCKHLSVDSFTETRASTSYFHPR